MQPSPQPMQVTSVDGSFAELSALFKEQREEAKADRAEQREEAKADRADMEAKLEQQRREMEAKMLEMREELTPKPAVTEEQLAALQSRLDAMHAAQLLTDDEVFALEDVVADFIALGLVTAEMASAHPTAAKLLQLVRLSEGIASDGSFARQARRKFV